MLTCDINTVHIKLIWVINHWVSDFITDDYFKLVHRWWKYQSPFCTNLIIYITLDLDFTETYIPIFSMHKQLTFLPIFVDLSWMSRNLSNSLTSEFFFFFAVIVLGTLPFVIFSLFTYDSLPILVYFPFFFKGMNFMQTWNVSDGIKLSIKSHPVHDLKFKVDFVSLCTVCIILTPVPFTWGISSTYSLSVHSLIFSTSA